MSADLTDGLVLVTAVGGAPGFDLTRMLLHDGYDGIAADAKPYAAGLFLPAVTPVVIPPSHDDRYADELFRRTSDASVASVRPPQCPARPVSVAPGADR